jgi:hypothetical protein
MTVLPGVEDGTRAIQNAADLLARTDEQLLAVLPHTNIAGVATRESITNELQRRELIRLSKSSSGLPSHLSGWRR